MSKKYLLPDGQTASAAASAARDSTGPGSWSDEDVQKWLRSPALAAWARELLSGLGDRFGEPWPRLLAAGLDGERAVPHWMETGAPGAHWLRHYLRQSDLAHAWFENGFLVDDPPWLDRLLQLERAQVARSFLLTGNLTDYAFDPVKGYRPTPSLLIESLLRIKDCVLSFRLSEGLRLHGVELDDERLDPMIRELIEQDDMTRVPISDQLRDLFGTIDRWLGGGRGGEESRSSHEFAGGVGVVFENVQLLIAEGHDDAERNFLIDSILRWSVSPELFRSSHCLVLLAESLTSVSTELRARGGKVEHLHLPRPETPRARLKFILPLLDPSSGMTETRVGQLPAGKSWLAEYATGSYLQRVARLSEDTAGMTLLGIEDLLQQASIQIDGTLSRQEVMRRKREQLHQESGGLLEVVEAGRKLDSIGGYKELKQRLREVAEALEASGDELVRATVPMGMLFIGPPGTGKSITAEALASESRVAMVKLGDFRGMYVGESERNLSRILGLLEALHPVVVFVDEIDQAFGGRDGASAGDSGVERRIFGRLLEFMSDTRHRGRILWIGASNCPEKIDAALKRPGRFDLLIPFLLPDETSREAILRVLIRRRQENIAGLESDLSDEQFASLATRTRGFSGAELAAVVTEVLRRLGRDRLSGKGRMTFDLPRFEEVLKAYRPPPGQRDRYRRMEERAVREVSFVDMLPERYRRGEKPGDKET